MEEKVPEKDVLWRLYDVALNLYKYVHSDVWVGQKYYTTLNIGIISIAIALLGIPHILEGPYWVVIILFAIGMITSIFGYFSIRKLREAFLSNIAFKTIVEYLLKDELELKKNDVSEKHQLTPFYSLPEEDVSSILKCPDLWKKQNIFRLGGVSCFFLLLQLIFVIVNLFGILLTLLLYFGYV